MYYSLARSPLRLPGSADIYMSGIMRFLGSSFWATPTCWSEIDTLTKKLLGPAATTAATTVQHSLPAPWKKTEPGRNCLVSEGNRVISRKSLGPLVGFFEFPNRWTQGRTQFWPSPMPQDAPPKKAGNHWKSPPKRRVSGRCCYWATENFWDSW